MTDRPNVLIVGAGIIGASIAWHVARAGARVTVLDAGAPGGIATRNSWAWINASWGNPEPYFRLRVHAMDEWRRLEREVPGIRVAWVGGLFWDLPPEPLAAFAAQHAAWGYPIRRVDRAAIRRIEPHLAAPPEVAVHVPIEGAVEPLDAALALLAAARELGATVIADTPARGLALSGERVTGVETDSGRLAADEVIVAAGVGTASLVASAGVVLPMTPSPAILVRSRPHAKCLNGLLISPRMELRQTADLRLLAAGAFADTAADADGAAAAAALFAAMRDMVDSGASLVRDGHAIGRRPMPKDRFPVVGRAQGIGGLTIAVMHSGVTLAPAIGRFVADEVLAGQRHHLLGPYGPERLTRTMQ